MVRLACSELNLATFEWTIASGLARSGTMTHDLQFEDALPPGGYTPAHRSDAEQNSKAIYNSQDPAQMLGNLEAGLIGATVIPKDFHCYLEDTVVWRKMLDR